MTAICYIGIELSARTQRVLLSVERLTRAAFAITALIKVYVNDPTGSLHVDLAWFSPFAVNSWGALVDGVLLGVFIYWGWDSGVAVNEESEDSSRGPANVLGDSITALGFGIAFYYGLTGFACAIYYRRELLKSARNFFYAGVLPVLGGAMLTGIFVKALIDYKEPDAGYSKPILGLGTPVVIGVGAILLGVVVMAIARFKYPAFFRRKPGVADPALLEAGAEPAPPSVAPNV
jgi:hypothetical protein